MLRPIFITAFAFFSPAISSAVDLPPIDRFLPFGDNVIALPAPQRINDTSPRTVQLLAAELERPQTTPDRKTELIGDLGRTHLPAAVAPLRVAAADSDPIIRASVATALGALDDPSASDTISKLAVDADPQVRAEAVRAAAALSRGDLVTKGLGDVDTQVIAAALSVAGAQQSTMLAPLIANKDEGLQILAINAAARANVASLANAVAAQLGADVPTRVAAVQALGVLRAAGQADEILNLLADANPTVRREAINALPGVMPAAAAQAHAIHMLTDADESVRTSAALVLAKAPGPAAVAPLIKQLYDPYTPLHETARAALLAAGGAAASAAVNLLDDPDPRRREDGSYLLGMLASSAGFQRHLKLLDDPDWAVVAQAAKSLGQISNPTVAPDLVRTLDRAMVTISHNNSQTSPAVAAATNAVVSAAQLGYVPIGRKVSAYIFQRGVFPHSFRSAAIWAVGIVGAPDESSIFKQLPSLIEDPFDAADVKIEAIKAVGNWKFSEGGAVFDAASKFPGSNETLAIIHWSKDRINGTHTPFTLPPQVYRADTSITDIPAN